MKQREFYCSHCGLFHWKDKLSAKGCPNLQCVSNGEDGFARIYKVGSMTFSHYTENHITEIKKIAWSSKEYAPEKALKHYEKQGIEIIN